MKYILTMLTLCCLFMLISPARAVHMSTLNINDGTHYFMKGRLASQPYMGSEQLILPSQTNDSGKMPGIECQIVGADKKPLEVNYRLYRNMSTAPVYEGRGSYLNTIVAIPPSIDVYRIDLLVGDSTTTVDAYVKCTSVPMWTHFLK